ncbi:hypothetical protein MUB04_15220 [Acinetobacter indicus]|uniref:hypothetical protein n=1 Tax=Acinetobacter TaxID=469 RepID=UPI0015D1CF92|nr:MULTISPECIES: hypothetical protein [Acinetobacter]MCP0917886.1 hypothetical protein [Acinetobacter indicus]
MNHNHSEACILGEGIVAKLLSVLNNDVVDTVLNDQNAETSLISEINDRIKSSCEIQLTQVVQRFFLNEDAESTALAFDVNPEHLATLKQGLELKADELLSSTRKILVLVALATHTTFDMLDSMVNDIIPTDSKYIMHHTDQAIAA